MTCLEVQERIPAYLENQLPLPEWRRIHAHLAGCQLCQEFAHDLEQLDAELARALLVPQLSPDFTHKLRQRIAAEAQLWSREERRARKQKLAGELELDLEKLRRGKLDGGSLAGMAGWATLIGFASWLLCELTLTVSLWASGPSFEGPLETSVLSLMAGAVFLLVGLLPVFSSRFQRFWKAFGQSIPKLT